MIITDAPKSQIPQLTLQLKISLFFENLLTTNYLRSRKYKKILGEYSVNKVQWKSNQFKPHCFQGDFSLIEDIPIYSRLQQYFQTLKMAKYFVNLKGAHF